MNQMWRSIRRKKKNRKSAKYKFSLGFKELVIDCSDGFKPEKVVIGWMHGHRRYFCKQRKTDSSFTESTRSLVVWPEAAADSLDIVTTLYKDAEDKFDDKEWTLVVEEVKDKGRHCPLAAISLNLRLFVGGSSEGCAKMDTKFKLRPLRDEVKFCSVQLQLTSMLVLDQPEESSKDNCSSGLASPSVLPTSIHQQKIKSPAIDKPVPVEVDSPLSTPSVGVPSEKSVIKIRHTIQSDSVAQPTSSIKEVRQISVVRKSTNENICISPSVSSQVEDDFGAHHFLNRQLSASQKVQSPPVSASTAPIYIADEGLLEWCQRITKDYEGVKITDFSKSFKSGLAFCALIHRYTPSLLGNYSRLDFSQSSQGHKENCRRAFDAAVLLGVDRSLDESETIILPNRQAIQLYVERLRIALQGNAGQSADHTDNIPRDISDHRISAIFALSEPEESVMNELSRLRQYRQKNAHDDQKDTKMEMANRSKEEFKSNSARPVYQEDDDFNPQKDLYLPSFGQRSGREAEKIRETASASHSVVDSSSVDAKEEERKRQLREEARSLMKKALTDSGSNITSTRSQVNHHQMSRSYMNGIDCDAAGESSNESSTISSNLRRSASIRSTTSLGSQSDLRTLGVVTPQVNFHKFRKHEPSPVLQRKNYESPLLPAFGKPTQKFVNGLEPSQSTYQNQQNFVIGSPLPYAAFDRMKRFGSMRSQEIADSIVQFVSPRVLVEANQRLEPTTTTSKPYDPERTPTRKLVTNFEKDLNNTENIGTELEELAERIVQVEKLDSYIDQKMRNLEPGSQEEQKMIEEHLKLLTEKDALVRRQDYLNHVVDLNETSHQITLIQKQLIQSTVAENDMKIEMDKQEIDDLMNKLKELVDRKNDLSHALINKEEEDEEESERGRLVMEKSKISCVDLRSLSVASWWHECSKRED
uniref:EH domain-binding protein 1 n=1 Tax=Ditylenchus dipsaci TaxID=166011 RepID=A0A915D814_9BILA